MRPSLLCHTQTHVRARVHPSMLTLPVRVRTQAEWEEGRRVHEQLQEQWLAAQQHRHQNSHPHSHHHQQQRQLVIPCTSARAANQGDAAAYPPAAPTTDTEDGGSTSRASQTSSGIPTSTPASEPGGSSLPALAQGTGRYAVPHYHKHTNHMDEGGMPQSKGEACGHVISRTGAESQGSPLLEALTQIPLIASCVSPSRKG